MGFFGSGDKKTTSTDNRAGASDNAQQAIGGGRIFNNGGGSANAPVQRTSNIAPWIQVGIAAAALIWLVANHKGKT